MCGATHRGFKSLSLRQKSAGRRSFLALPGGSGGPAPQRWEPNRPAHDGPRSSAGCARASPTSRSFSTSATHWRSSGPSPTCSTRKGSPEAEAFVKARALRLLSGEVSQVVKGLRGIIIGAAPPGVIVFSRSWSMRNCLPADQLRSAGGLDPGQQGGTTAYPGARSLSAALVRCLTAGFP